MRENSYLRKRFMARILAIDYGKKRVGIAVTDELQIIATPLITVAAKDIFMFLKDYISKENVECIVVGEPKQMNNMPSESAVYVEPFVKKLRAEYPALTIDRLDERFTSKIAFQAMIDGGLKKKDRQNKALIDAVSATVILQDYMNFKTGRL